MNQVILNLITTYALMYGVDPKMAQAIVSLESKGNIFAIGSHGELGLMQLRPQYFAKSCLKGASMPMPKGLKLDQNKVPCGYELFKPEVNLEIGMKNLAQMMSRCSHKTDGTWVLCHNLGVRGASRIQRPKDFIYYRLVMKEYENIVAKESLTTQASQQVASRE